MDELLCNEEDVLVTTVVPEDYSTDRVDVMRRMLKREAEYERCNDNFVKEVQRHGMEESWHRKICRWMFETAKAFDMTLDTVGCAVYFMDRYLSIKSVDKIMLQLVSMVSMYIASKMHEHQPISMEEMELLSQRKFTREDMRRVEAQLVSSLDWRLTPPTSFMFARDFILLLKNVDEGCKADMEAEVMIFLQDVQIECGSLRFLSSSIGIAAVHVVWNARRMRPSVAIQDAIHAVDMTSDDFVDCYRWLRELYSISHQLSPVARFISVEESKTTDPSRSISPTSPDDAEVLASGADDLPDDQFLKELLAVSDEEEKEEDEDEVGCEEPSRKRARRDSS